MDDNGLPKRSNFVKFTLNNKVSNICRHIIFGRITWVFCCWIGILVNLPRWTKTKIKCHTKIKREMKNDNLYKVSFSQLLLQGNKSVRYAADFPILKLYDIRLTFFFPFVSKFFFNIKIIGKTFMYTGWTKSLS